MIDLLSVKLNNDYDFVQNSLPTSDGTWLCTEDITGYSKGYSYQITNNVATRIEAKQDYKIQNAIYSTIQLVCDYLNNYFLVKRQAILRSHDCMLYPWISPIFYIDVICKYICACGSFTFSNKVISEVENNPFNVGDLVYARGQRNNYFSCVTASTSDSITFNNTSFTDTTENALISLVAIPDKVQEIISQMIFYDVFVKNNNDLNTLQSERIGNYTYTKADFSVSGLCYPPEIVCGLVNYRKLV